MNRFLRSVGICLCAALLRSSAPGLDPHKSATQFTHTSWTAKDGIPGPVRAIRQTPDGYLWLGTEAGLYRFDGLRFVLWQSSFGEQLLSSAVWSLCAARDGSLWIGFGSGGISQLSHGRLKNYSVADGAPSGGILSIVEDKNGAIWAGGSYGFGKLENGKWRKIGADLGYPAPGAQTLLVDHRGGLWVATNGLNFGFSKDQSRNSTILTLAPNAKRFAGTGIDIGQVWSMAEAPDGDVWIADTNGRTVRTIQGGSRPKREIAVDAESLCLLFDDDSSLWIGLIEGGLRHVTNFRQPTNLPPDRFEPNDGLSGGLVLSTFKDREDNVWFGTTVGLDRFSESKVTPLSTREGLVPDQQIALASTRDSIWLISYARDTILQVRDGRILASRLPPYSRSDSTRILSLFADGDRRVWVGGNFKLAEQADGKFSFVPNAGALGDRVDVEAITRDADGDLWISLTDKNRLHRVWRWRKGQWTDFRKSANLPQYRSRVMYGDRRGRVWLGFEDGEVAIYNHDEFHTYSAKDGLPNGRILTIVGDRAGHVWIGGEGGLSRFDQGHFTTLTARNGLPGNSISGIVEDDDGFLWLAGSLGILRVSPQDLDKALKSSSYRMQGMSLDAADGLRGLPRQREPFPTVTRAADGRLWFATTGGATVIDPKYLPKNLIPPLITIETVKADDRVLAASAGVQLPPNTRNLEIAYAGLGLTAPERVRFRYKLEGFDDNWRGPVSARSATYTNLPPRNYRFHVIACNNDGVWNQEGAVLEFGILPAFYQTLWFHLLEGGLVLGLGFAAYRFRVRSLHRRQKLLEKRVQERTQEIQERTEEISVQKLRFQQLFENAPVGIVMLDGQDKVIAVNRVFETMFQFTSEELFRKPINDVIIPDSHLDEASDISRRVTQNRFAQWETVRKRRDGSLIPVELYGVPIASDGQVEGMYGMYVDISQRRHAENELKKAKESAESANYSKGVFLATMSHEIRTPMNGILGLTELLLDTPLTPEQRGDLSMVKISANSLLTVINDVLDFSKIEAGKLEFEHITFDLRQTLGEAMKPLAFRAGKKNLELVYEVGSRVPQTVVGDPVRLIQVMANLIGNAIKFTERGEIVVRVNQQADDVHGTDIPDHNNTVCLHISVADTGIGIPLDKQKSIFESFTQAEGSTTRKYGGTGLGLAICSRLVEAMGGKIWVENRETQPGSIFHFTVLLTPGKEAGTQQVIPQETAALSGLPVLIVDDNAASRHQLMEMLVGWGMTPTSVEGGSFALQALTKAERSGKAFQLILLDTNMPEMDGFTVAEKMRRSSALGQVSILMLTSGGSSGDAVRSRELEISGYVTKPVLETELFSAIRAAVGAEATDKVAASATSSVSSSNSKRPLNILLVEDNRVNQVLATRILEKQGHHVSVAGNGLEALAILTSNPFDLILMDIEMPEMDGLEATRSIRENESPSGKHLPIIAMTAHAMTGDRDKYLTAGMDAYISKPIDAKHLLEMIERLCSPEVPLNGSFILK